MDKVFKHIKDDCGTTPVTVTYQPPVSVEVEVNVNPGKCHVVINLFDKLNDVIDKKTILPPEKPGTKKNAKIEGDEVVKITIGCAKGDGKCDFEYNVTMVDSE